LFISLVEVFVLALVFPGKEVFLPNISPTFTPTLLACAFFKSERIASVVCLGRRGVTYQMAYINEVFFEAALSLSVALLHLATKS
jgi:hypothetical protein